MRFILAFVGVGCLVILTSISHRVRLWPMLVFHSFIKEPEGSEFQNTGKICAQRRKTEKGSVMGSVILTDPFSGTPTAIFSAHTALPPPPRRTPAG